MKAVGYVRVSTEEQHLGVEAQKEAILKFAGANGFEVVRFFEDVGVSGAVPAFERPGFRGAVEFCRGNGIKVIIVYAIDRLGRSFTDIFETVRRLEESGIQLVSTREEFLKTLNPMLRNLVLSVLAWAADYERYLIRERTRQALRAKGVKHEVVLPEGLQDVIVQLYTSGWGIKKIAKKLGVSERQVRKVLYRKGLLELPEDRCPRCFARMVYDYQYRALYCPNCGYIKRATAP